jgi:hypothetical protein
MARPGQRLGEQAAHDHPAREFRVAAPDQALGELEERLATTVRQG